MKETFATYLLLSVVACIFLDGCRAKAQLDPAAGAPPPARVEKETNDNIFKVDNPGQFPMATADKHSTSPELKVTGTVSPDISKAIPVISIASGRIVEIHARIGDSVKKGQLLYKVQSQDISQAFSDYRQAIADERLAKTQLERAKLLYDKGAIAKKDLEVVEENAEKFTVTVDTTLAHLKVLGADVKNPTALVSVYAPVAGVITDQQITLSAGTQGLASPSPLTISDLSHVWIICDVYENDMSFVHVGEFADIHLNAYRNSFRSKYSHGKSSTRGRKFWCFASRNVCNSGLSQPTSRHEGSRSRQCDFTSARSRLGLCTARGRTVPKNAGRCREHACQ